MRLIILIMLALSNVGVNAQSLIVKSKGKLELTDTVSVLNLDSLVLNKKSALVINNKKEFVINARYIILEEKSSISAHDGKNNGTNLTINGKFIKIGKSVIDVSGQTYLVGNKEAPNGNGGNLIINYERSGLAPQSKKSKENNYLETLFKGASTSLNPEVDLQNIWYRVRMNSGMGRPMGTLPNGKVFDATIGKDGMELIEEIKY